MSFLIFSFRWYKRFCNSWQHIEICDRCRKGAPAIFQATTHFAFIVAFLQNFLPTSNTCINRLNLPRATVEYNLPEQSRLFQLYDYTFSNQYFGQKWENYITFAQTADSTKHMHVTKIKECYTIVMLESKKKIVLI